MGSQRGGRGKERGFSFVGVVVVVDVDILATRGRFEVFGSLRCMYD